MFSRRGDSLSTIIERAARLDLYERNDLERLVAEAILAYVRRSKARDIDDLVERVRDVCASAGYLGLVCTTCRLLELSRDAAVEYGLGVDEYKVVVSRIFQVLGTLYKNMEQRYLGVVGEAIPRDSTVLVLSYDRRITRLVSALAYKFERVLIPVREPMKSGVGIAESLHRKGVNAAYIPDYSLAWAVRQADAVLADAIGVAPGESVIVDAGVAPATSLAGPRGSRVIVLMPLEASCQWRGGETASLPSVLVESAGGGPMIRVTLVDLLDPGRYTFSIATENTVQEASRQVVRERVRVVEDIIDDTLRSTLDTMI